jgi:hypothetical protein
MENLDEEAFTAVGTPFGLAVRHVGLGIATIEG